MAIEGGAVVSGPAREFRVGRRRLGPGRPCFVIAEAGVNHNGRLALARRLVDAAARAGADAVKFQTFRAERLVTRRARPAPYQRRGVGRGESTFEMLRRLELSEKDHRALAAHSRRRNILFLSTPFDPESAGFLARLGVPLFKVSSGDLTDLPFLESLARRRKPLVLSTGMSTLAEVRAALRAVRRAGAKQVALLHCVSNYPAAPADVNLRAMDALVAAFGVPVGFSDHTPGIEVSLAAVARGACVIEKHFTLDRRLPGPDHRASLEPAELAALVRGIRRVESALGDGRKRPAPSERAMIPFARKSLVALRDIAVGEKLAPEMVGAKRPGTGLAPAALRRFLGKKVRRPVAADRPLTAADFRGGRP